MAQAIGHCRLPFLLFQRVGMAGSFLLRRHYGMQLKKKGEETRF